MDREDSGATASQSHSFPSAARTLVSTPGLPVKVFPPVLVSLPGQKKLTRSLQSAPHKICKLIGWKVVVGGWVGGGGGGRTGCARALFMCIRTQINADAYTHVRAHYAPSFFFVVVFLARTCCASKCRAFILSRAIGGVSYC